LHAGALVVSVRANSHFVSLCRHVILPTDVARLCPKNKLLSEQEWRNLNVQQSRGWEHYAVHK
jgi:hypothetical protein